MTGQKTRRWLTPITQGSPPLGIHQQRCWPFLGAQNHTGGCGPERLLEQLEQL
jgi:hypothetical protein